ncbi:MAG TPA: DoxX family protein [Chitinophagaceae bacterium]|nr:DoxX family protein [Chitinophagaceae bacterium]
MSHAITTGKIDLRQSFGLTLLRFALGAILIWRGFEFVRDSARLKSLTEQTGVGIFSQNAGAIALVVTILTLLCGFFIFVGLFTRLSSIVQIPIVLVAILFVNVKHIERSGFELILAIVVLLLLILFAIKGSGSISADEYFRRGAAMDRDSDKFF